jgi:hypothetical protein
MRVLVPDGSARFLGWRGVFYFDDALEGVDALYKSFFTGLTELSSRFFPFMGLIRAACRSSASSSSAKPCTLSTGSLFTLILPETTTALEVAVVRAFGLLRVVDVVRVEAGALVFDARRTRSERFAARDLIRPAALLGFATLSVW